MNIALFLTCLRLSFIPLFVLVYYLPYSWAHPVATFVFVIAAITDALDGFFARKLSLQTELGAFLDPVADKLLVACVLVIVIGQHLMPYLAIAAAVIVMREIAISALREWMAELGKRASVAVILVAKVKTILQMIALGLLVWYSPYSSQVFLIAGSILLWVAAVLTIWSMIIYLRISWPDLTSPR